MAGVKKSTPKAKPKKGATTAKPKKAVGRSELARRARAKQRAKLKSTIVRLTTNDLLKIVRNRKALFGHGMGEFRVPKITRQVPVPNSKQFTIHGEQVGEEGKLHIQTMSFYSVDYSDVPDKEHPLTVRTGKGETKGMELLSLSKNPIQVRCSCEDFYYTAWYYDKRHKVLLGPKMKPYVRKTPPPPAGLPYRNPRKLPIFCKHILQLVNRLRAEKILK